MLDSRLLMSSECCYRIFRVRVCPIDLNWVRLIPVWLPLWLYRLVKRLKRGEDFIDLCKWGILPALLRILKHFAALIFLMVAYNY